MNNSPNNGRNSYDNTYNNAPSRQMPQRRPENRTVPQQGQGRPMTDEERRRLAAARARMNNGAAPRPNPNGVPGGQRPVNPNGQPRPNPNNPGYRPQNPNRTGQPQNRPVNRTAPQQRPPESLAGRRRKRKVKINAGAVIFVLLIAGVIGVSAYQITHSPASTAGDDTQKRYEEIIQSAKENAILNGTYNEDSITEEVPVTEPAPESSTTIAAEGEFGTVTVQNSTMNEGALVLVNFNYAYDRIDDVELKNAYNERTGKIKVSSTTLGMEPEAFAALEELVSGLVADTGCDDLLLYSGHRTLADQQRIWDSNLASYGEDYTKTYVAVPGHSEHHTGYACDLGFYTDDGLSIPLVDHEYGPWVWAHCTEYGYILRYPAEKADITGIGHEQWHFRYVGLPHAYASDVTGLCLEEYLDHLKGYTADTKMLHISADRRLTDMNPAEIADLSGGWLTYYVPAAEGDTTEIKIPGGDKFADYEISGNNVDGFIVTITLG